LARLHHEPNLTRTQILNAALYDSIGESEDSGGDEDENTERDEDLEKMSEVFQFDTRDQQDEYLYHEEANNHQQCEMLRGQKEELTSRLNNCHGAKKKKQYTDALMEVNRQDKERRNRTIIMDQNREETTRARAIEDDLNRATSSSSISSSSTTPRTPTRSVKPQGRPLYGTPSIESNLRRSSRSRQPPSKLTPQDTSRQGYAYNDLNPEDEISEQVKALRYYEQKNQLSQQQSRKRTKQGTTKSQATQQARGQSPFAVHDSESEDPYE